MSKLTAFDLQMLNRALLRAREFVGRTAPNPPVGAVCVRNGRILGEGAHQKAGTPHAEVNCLNSCTESPEGATLYVTLEPCSTVGRTPACCDLIRKQKIGRVVIGCLDPNPKHAGRAVDILTAARIRTEVAEGETEARCRAFVAPFIRAITDGLPYIRLKLAMTLDGYVADCDGTSKWITGPEARNWVQHLRAEADAIMVGAQTVFADHPSLQPHLEGAPKKIRVLVDGSRPLPISSADAMTLIASRDLGYDGSDLTSMLRVLCARGINDVICEGGGRLGASLLEAGLVSELNIFYAPLILGDTRAVRGLPVPPRRLPEVRRWHVFERRALGQDTLLRMIPPEEQIGSKNR